MIEFKMPALGADMEAGRLVEWKKQPGDPVHRGDILADVETDKGVIAIESFDEGVLDRAVVASGQEVPVGTLLALIRSGTEREDTTSTPSPSPLIAPPRRAISPAARRLAEERGLDASTIVGTGPEGAVTREDVERSAAAPPIRGGAPADRAQRMRQTIAAAMSRSKREIPHYYLSHTIDMQPVADWLQATNEQRPIANRLLDTVLLVKAVALALRQFPEFNSTWEGDRPVEKPEIHVGIAIALRQGGLVAPAIHHTDQKSTDELMAGFQDLVGRAKSGVLKATELSDATITVTSLGDRGVEAVFGVIYPPQTAIVGFGKIVERPWCVNGQIQPRHIMIATLSADHRVTDGHRGALFLAAIDRLLQEPAQL